MYVCIKIYGCIIRTSQEYLAEMVVEVGGGLRGVQIYRFLLSFGKEACDIGVNCSG